MEFVLQAEHLDGNEMVCDFLVVKELIGEYLEAFDHAICVNTADPGYAELRSRYGEKIISFENEDPTTEVMARVIFEAFVKRLADYSSNRDPGLSSDREVRLVSVKVWETASSWAEYCIGLRARGPNQK